MFETIKNWWKGVRNKMFPLNTLEDAIDGELAISQAMLNRVSLWRDMVGGHAPWIKEDIHSMRLERAVCREFANVALNEMESSVTNASLDEIYRQAIRNLNENLQDGLGLGSFCIKPMGIDGVEYVTADQFVPQRFDSSGRLTKVSFIETKMIKKDSYYYRIECHDLTNNGLTISNRAYHSNTEGSFGKQVDLADVPEWAKLPEFIRYPMMDRPDFGYYRNPIKNDIDGSFCGVSVFDSAFDLLRKTDTQFSRLDWEYESGERAVHVDSAAFIHTEHGDKLPERSKRLYRGLNISMGNDKELFDVFSPEFRDQSIINGLEEYKRDIEFNVSLAYGDLSKNQEVEKTATEVRVSKQRKYNMVKAIQKNLSDCLDDLVYALAFYNGMTQSGYKFKCDFSDSILTDADEERKSDRVDLSIGAMTLLDYRMKWYKETKAEALKHIIQETPDLQE